jgi:hypothetical protein
MPAMASGGELGGFVALKRSVIFPQFFREGNYKTFYR